MDQPAPNQLISSPPVIPVENIYFLFCYAWNRFEEAKSIPLSGVSSPDLPNLLARVLLYGTRSLLRRGLDRNYQPVREEIATVRGHIELGQSMLLQARSVRRLVCEFDELSQDLLHNQIIKASLKRLARAPMLEQGLARDLRQTAARLGHVSDIRLERATFARVKLHRNNAYYDLILRLTELAFDCLLPDRATGTYAFHDVLRDEVKMAKIFEAFVRNFYAAEQSEFEVLPLSFHWDAEPLSVSGAARLPTMITDVYMKSTARRIIIDTKFYLSSLQKSYHGSASFHSENLYQLFAYLKNVAGKNAGFANCEGILLYPEVQQPLSESYVIQGHPVTIATIDLSQPWQHISNALLAIIEAPRER